MAEMCPKQLVDAHGREISDLRVSITDRCNFRCQYCMPAEGLPWLERDSILTYEEFARIVGVFSDMGINQVRVTGGEPLVRKDVHRFVSLVSSFSSVRDLSLTTNGYMLKDQIESLVKAGLRRINISLDSLSRDRFFQITRRDSLDRVIEGLEETEKYPQLERIKVNVVAMKGITEDEILKFARLARSKPYVIRFIEYMPLDAQGEWKEELVLPNDIIRDIIAQEYPLIEIGRDPHSTSSRYRFANNEGELGFVSPVTQPFCSDCNRVRITADGKLRTCLFSQNETDLCDPIRSGANDDDLAEIIRGAVQHKELRHRIGKEDFKQPERPMSRIGG